MLFFILILIFPISGTFSDNYPTMTLSYPKYNKMMKLFGKVASETETTSSIDNEDCIEDCRNAPDCILAFMTSMGYCKLYNYSTTLILTVEELSGDQGLYVAFKVGFYQEIDACPASYNSKTFMLMIGEEAVRWTRTQTGWVINNCPEPWKMFSRNDSIKVCMRFFHTSDHATTRQEAIETCESQGFKLTGLTAEEVEYWKPGKAPLDHCPVEVALVLVPWRSGLRARFVSGQRGFDTFKAENFFSILFSCFARVLRTFITF